jgi:hypothetical protein
MAIMLFQGPETFFLPEKGRKLNPITKARAGRATFVNLSYIKIRCPSETIKGSEKWG